MASLPLLAALLSLASGCATSSTPLVVSPRPATIPEGLKQPFAPLADLPDRALTTQDMARALGEARYAYGACRLRHSALAAASTHLETQGD
jgi:hypothetical protein